VHPDPLEFLYNYEDRCDREVVGLVASSLAYGRVAQILKSVSCVLERMQPTPSVFLRQSSKARMYRTFADFRHRFTTGGELSALLWGVKGVIDRYGSLNACFATSMGDGESTTLPALASFVQELNAGSGLLHNSLLPSPARGSACKRLNLFLRWMVRQDMVDPGGWEHVPVSKLVIPLDTHMHRICLALRLTHRRQADLRTALEVTAAFRVIAPHDPVRYDFALTRLGIRNDTDLDAFLEKVVLQ